jgi:hypothetical protein
MSLKASSISEQKQPNIYQIRIKGHLDDQRSDWFEGLAIAREEGGDTLLTGPVVDDAALYGLLKRVRDLGLPLISVNRVEPSHPSPSATKNDQSNL